MNMNQCIRFGVAKNTAQQCCAVDTSLELWTPSALAFLGQVINVSDGRYKTWLLRIYIVGIS